MFSVFSNTKMKMSEQIRELQKCPGALYYRGLLGGTEEELLQIQNIEEGKELLAWANEKILYELPKIKEQKNAQWVYVRLRIFTSMLNKLESSNILDKNTCQMYHKRFTSNLRKILNEIYIEDLPF